MSDLKLLKKQLTNLSVVTKTMYGNTDDDTMKTALTHVLHNINYTIACIKYWEEYV